MKTLRVASIVGALLWIGLTSCGSRNSSSGTDSGGTGLPFDLTGTWSGTWTSDSGPSGTFSGDFVQASPTQGGGSPRPLSGTASFDGSACQGALNVTASVQPGGFVKGPRVAGTFDTPSITIEFHALITLDSRRIHGNYSVLVGGACSGDTGTLTASLQVPLQVDPTSHSYTEVVLTGLDGETTVIRTETEEVR